MLILDTSVRQSCRKEVVRFGEDEGREKQPATVPSKRLSGSRLKTLVGIQGSKQTREEIALQGEVSRGAYSLEPFSTADVAEAKSIIERYADLGLGLADASNVVLANRYDTLDVLTLDERRFRILRGGRASALFVSCRRTRLDSLAAVTRASSRTRIRSL